MLDEHEAANPVAKYGGSASSECTMRRLPPLRPWARRRPLVSVVEGVWEFGASASRSTEQRLRRRWAPRAPALRPGRLICERRAHPPAMRPALAAMQTAAAFAVPAIPLFIFVSAIMNVTASGESFVQLLLLAGYVAGVAGLISVMPAASQQVFNRLATKFGVFYSDQPSAAPCSAAAANSITWRCAAIYLIVAYLAGVNVLPQFGVPAGVSFSIGSVMGAGALMLLRNSIVNSVVASE